MLLWRTTMQMVSCCIGPAAMLHMLLPLAELEDCHTMQHHFACNDMYHPACLMQAHTPLNCSNALVLIMTSPPQALTSPGSTAHSTLQISLYIEFSCTQLLLMSLNRGKSRPCTSSLNEPCCCHSQTIWQPNPAPQWGLVKILCFLPVLLKKACSYPAQC